VFKIKLLKILSLWIGLCVFLNGYVYSNSLISHDPTSADFNLNDKVVSSQKISINENINTVKKVEVSKKLTVNEEFKLTAISKVGDNYRAYINNNWLVSGQHYSSIKVIEIKSDYVLVLKALKTYKLSISKQPSVFELKENSQELNQAVIGNEYE